MGMHFMRHNSVVIDTTYDLIHFSHLTMQVKFAASEASAELQPVFIHDSIILKTKSITAFVGHPLEWHTTGTVTTVGKFTEAASL